MTKFRKRKKSLHFIPIAISFSELERQSQDDEKDKVYEILDKKQTELGKKVDYELLICQILYNLNNQEKMAFFFEILRNDGYNIDNESIAKIMRVKIRYYMFLLDSVRRKIAIILRRNDLLYRIKTRKLGRRT